SLHLAFKLAEHDKFICIGLFASAINFQVAQDQRTFPISLKKNKWIRRPKLRGVKHVGIGLAGRNDKTGLPISNSGFSISDFHLTPSHFQLLSQNPMQQREQTEG